MCVFPPSVTMPGGKPVMVVPGEVPSSPATTVAPVFVTVEPPSTWKFAAEPSPRAGAAKTDAKATPPVPLNITERTRHITSRDRARRPHQLDLVFAFILHLLLDVG